MFFDLTHLTQNDSQQVLGPIQDEEALFLYSLIRGMRIRTVFEIGGLDGYSAMNFLKAVGPYGKVFTCDVNPVNRISENHVVILKDARNISMDDLQNNTIELLFFDCHEYDAQMETFYKLKNFGILDDQTVIVIHDTNTHNEKYTQSSYKICEGYVHQPVERKMVNEFVNMGYSAFSLHPKPDKYDSDFLYRHGLTILQIHKKLNI